MATTTNSKEAIVAFTKSVGTQMSSMIDLLEEPYRTQYTAVKKEWDTMLAGLAPTDMVANAREANWGLDSLFNCLLSMQSAMSIATSGLTSLRSKYASALLPDQVAAKIAEGVTAAIAGKVQAGELMPAERVTQLCSDAKANVEKALKEEFATKEASIRQEMATAVEAAAGRVKLVTSRSTLLASEKLPLPEEGVLGLEEAAFAAQKTVATARLKKLTDAGASDGELLASMIWLPEGDYVKQEKLILRALECAKRDGGEMFAVPPAERQCMAGAPSF